MKKITLLTVALVAIAFASCKKDYTCTCSSTYLSSTSTTITKIKGVSKKAAEANCASGTSTFSSGSFSGSMAQTCTLAK